VQPFGPPEREDDVTVAVVESTARPDPITTAAEAAAPFPERYPALYRGGYRVAYRLLGSREDAADVAQEACARAFAGWKKIAGHASPEAWVARVSANLAIDVWRRRATARSKQPASPPAGDGVSSDRVDLHRALAALPRRQREVVLLRFLADQSEQTVARTLGCSVGTVKSQASRGLEALRRNYRVEG
jgi:RNA polymerase sigma-70 factor (sigma-E family)